MATEAVNMNGLYDTQYGQPAELAATTPSHVPSASQSSTAAAAQQQSQKADPQEIGWYFVEQYYTTLSKSPDRIHLFYSKKSQLVTGVEAEKVLPSVGTKAINEKIKSLDIQDCKVRVLNVDSQSSYDNIVVQVIGEMSNKSEPHHKFVQTFILATQPNGYFVLNDIFRYLNEDEDEIVEDEPVQEEVPVAESAAQDEKSDEAGAAEETVTTETAPDKADEKAQAAVEEPVVAVEEEEQEEEEQEEQEEQEEEEEVVNGVDTEPAASETATADAEPKAPESDPVVEPATEQPAEPESIPAEAPAKTAPVSEGPPARKTWASMVGTKATAIPALPVVTVPAASQPKVQRPAQPAQATKAPVDSGTDTSTSTTATQSNGWQTADHGKKAKAQQSKAAEGIVHAYIKNVNEKVDARVLREVLEKFGELKYYDVARPRNCAFVEFADPAGYAAAVAANPHTVGTESISVEERRPRPGAFAANTAQFPRGSSNTGRGRGGMQQRTGSQGGTFPKDAGRGGFPQRGGKPGNVTPKGRGQTQAA